MRLWWIGAGLLTIAIQAKSQEYLSPPPADPSPITDHLAFRAIWFEGKVGTNARFDPSQTTPGTYFSAEQTLGLTDRADQFRAELVFRLEDRDRLRVNWLDLRRSGDTIVTENIQYGTETFLSGEEVKSELDYREMDVTDTYSFLRYRRFELGAGLGVQLIEAEADAEVPNTSRYANFSAEVPFVTPAIDTTYLIAKHWSLNARAQYLHATISSTSALYEDYHGDLQYRWKPNLAIGLGFEYQEISLDLERNNPAGLIRLKLDGPEVSLRASF
jgi:hypothetical protein